MISASSDSKSGGLQEVVDELTKKKSQRHKKDGLTLKVLNVTHEEAQPVRVGYCFAPVGDNPQYIAEAFVGKSYINEKQATICSGQLEKVVEVLKGDPESLSGLVLSDNDRSPSATRAGSSVNSSSTSEKEVGCQSEQNFPLPLMQNMLFIFKQVSYGMFKKPEMKKKQSLSNTLALKVIAGAAGASHSNPSTAEVTDSYPPTFPLSVSLPDFPEAMRCSSTTTGANLSRQSSRTQKSKLLVDNVVETESTKQNPPAGAKSNETAAAATCCSSSTSACGTSSKITSEPADDGHSQVDNDQLSTNKRQVESGEACLQPRATVELAAGVGEPVKEQDGSASAVPKDKAQPVEVATMAAAAAGVAASELSKTVAEKEDVTAAQGNAHLKQERSLPTLSTDLVAKTDNPDSGHRWNSEKIELERQMLQTTNALKQLLSRQKKEMDRLIADTVAKHRRELEAFCVQRGFGESVASRTKQQQQQRPLSLRNDGPVAELTTSSATGKIQGGPMDQKMNLEPQPSTSATVN
ncbi:conserved hypothetical protein, partial [Trichinella spiralis]|uniref:hypothetical protein n=1 Tax=Trichinella spiralis TaxID=6334 RepID=UPI0001EFE3FC